MMFHEEIRDARIRAGFSQNTLARLAKVPRSQLRKLEEGGNVTLATVQKILDQLPGVQMSLAPAPVDKNALEEAVKALLAATEQLLFLLAGLRPPEDPVLEDKMLEITEAMREGLPPQPPEKPPTRFEIAEQLASMVEELHASYKPKKTR